MSGKNKRLNTEGYNGRKLNREYKDYYIIIVYLTEYIIKHKHLMFYS